MPQLESSQPISSLLEFFFSQEATDIGPVISARQLDRIEDQVERSKAFGATALTGGRRPRPDTMLEKGHFYEPTVLTGVTPENFGWNQDVHFECEFRKWRADLS